MILEHDRLMVYHGSFLTFCPFAATEDYQTHREADEHSHAGPGRGNHYYSGEGEFPCITQRTGTLIVLFKYKNISVTQISYLIFIFVCIFCTFIIFQYV